MFVPPPDVDPVFPPPRPKKPLWVYVLTALAQLAPLIAMLVSIAYAMWTIP